jgi:hypothetical protein
MTNLESLKLKALGVWEKSFRAMPFALLHVPLFQGMRKPRWLGPVCPERDVVHSYSFLFPKLVETEDIDVRTYCTKVRCGTPAGARSPQNSSGAFIST